MSNSNEHIEARLAAYIDGECSPAERAEIEKYLAGNPAHRQLIDDLLGIKGKIGDLPREAAPAEVLDYLQTNLERHALLEDVEQSAASMHINRWPQFAAVAAVLLLTVGLGSLIYLVLPQGEFDRDQIVLAPPAVQKLPTNPSLAEANLEDRKIVDADKSIAIAPTIDTTPKMDVLSKGETTSNITATPANTANSINGPITLNNGSAIVVKTDDLLLTQNLVAGYLGQNQYQFTPITSDAVNNRGVLNNNSNQALLNAGANQAQDAGEMVAKLKLQENLQTESEAYLLVRNVSNDKASELSRALGNQRGDRQQARFYSNTVINSSGGTVAANEVAAKVNAGFGAGGVGGATSQINPQDEQQSREKAIRDNLGSKNNIAENFNEKPSEVTPQLSKTITEPGAESKMTPVATVPHDDPSKPAVTTLPVEGIETTKDQPTDVLIIVQAVPEIIPAASTQPATQPSTQPATQPVQTPVEITSPTSQPSTTQPIVDQ